MAVLNSYDLNGKKLSFANWISNLSPTETPFCSMTGKEATNQTTFFWQNDRLQKAAAHAVLEGSDVDTDTEVKTSDPDVKQNFTQILRRSFKVSDTADAMANYGRGREVAYQMEKSSLAIKRDLEKTLLNPKQVGEEGSGTVARKTDGFFKLVAASGAKDEDTGAEVHFKSTDSANKIGIADIQKMTYNLYLANSEANVIMFHPKWAAFFATLQEKEANTKMFDGDESTFSHYVNVYIDEFGREYKLVPNRYMDEKVMYFFNPKDFTQMILRAPQKIELAKKGNYQHWMVEMEVGLRLRDQFCAGVIEAQDYT